MKSIFKIACILLLFALTQKATSQALLKEKIITTGLQKPAHALISTPLGWVNPKAVAAFVNVDLNSTDNLWPVKLCIVSAATFCFKSKYYPFCY